MVFFTSFNLKIHLYYRLNLISYLYLTLIIISMIAILGGNLLVSSIYSNNFLNNLGIYTLIYFFYFSVLFFGIFYAFIGIKLNNNQNIELQNKFFKRITLLKFQKAKKTLRKICKIISRITFIIGIIFGLVIIIGSFGVITTFIAIISAQFGLFFSIIFFANTILLLKLNNHKKNSKKYYRISFIGFVVSGLLMTPFLLTDPIISDIDDTFSNAFGRDWRYRIPVEINNYFLKDPFSLMGYFLGTPPKDCIIEKNTLFYNGEGIKLYFDAYMPLDRGVGLPGENSTIIRIHGGGWTSGDKGVMNMMQMNKYFAAQGYIVFDIQYGLDDNFLFKGDPLTPKYKKGNFGIDDMVRHIGIFTKFLANHSEKYRANLESIFISGGSAGGHLTCAVGLAIASGNYTDLFGENIIIKGLIPFYPANGQMGYFGISGSKNFKNPEMLIEENSPPCLIFQGTHDILNYFSVSEKIRDTYITNGNNKCAILWMPFGGHASDFYFNGYYNQMFLYYFERFIYLFH